MCPRPSSRQKVGWNFTRDFLRDVARIMGLTATAEMADDYFASFRLAEGATKVASRKPAFVLVSESLRAIALSF